MPLPPAGCVRASGSPSGREWAKPCGNCVLVTGRAARSSLPSARLITLHAEAAREMPPPFASPWTSGPSQAAFFFSESGDLTLYGTLSGYLLSEVPVIYQPPLGLVDQFSYIKAPIVCALADVYVVKYDTFALVNVKEDTIHEFRGPYECELMIYDNGCRCPWNDDTCTCAT